MNAFLVSLFAIALIAITSALVLDDLRMSSERVYQSASGSVRLN